MADTNIFRRIGVEPVINCMGTYTIIGGSIERPAVREAMEAAAHNFVQYDELADGIGQRLTALELFSEALATDLRSAAPHLEAAAREMTLELRKTVVQTRLLSHGLSPVPLEADGLARALRELAAGVSGLARVRCEFESRGDVVLADSAAATHLYRIAQEAVNNALKHAGARRISLSLHRNRGRLELRVMDDGRGLNAQQTSLDGVGLRVMRFRADLIGATLELSSKNRRGTCVCCILRKDT